jgi:hypothetical protein
MSDVKQAAERLHKHYTASSREQSPYWHDRGIDQQIEDEQAIVDNAVAEHDPTPIDAEFLRSVGFVGDTCRLVTRHERLHFVVDLLTGNRWYVEDESGDSVEIPAPTTRGSFTRLARALGIET